MSSVDPASVASSLVAMQGASLGQDIAIAIARQQADAQASVVALLTKALDASASPPAPPGQGVVVDRRA